MPATCWGNSIKPDRSWTQLITRNEGHAGAYTVLGLIAKKTTGDRGEEKSFYEQALQVDADHLLALVNLASTLQDEGNITRPAPS